MSSRVQIAKDESLGWVLGEYESGRTISSISGELPVSQPTVRSWLEEAGYRRKGRGRIPLAMKARVRDLKSRGWKNAQISSLLTLKPALVSEILKESPAEDNPSGILGGGPDPLALKSQKEADEEAKRKKKKKKGKKKKGKKSTEKEVSKEDKEAEWPPRRHRCNKHWRPEEKEYVMDMMKAGVQPSEIYRRMRASKKRQIRIWREAGNSGNPPNFPPPRTGRPPPSGAPALPPAPDRDSVSLESFERRVQAERRERKLESDRLQKEIERKDEAIKLLNFRIQSLKDQIMEREEGQRRREELRWARQRGIERLAERRPRRFRKGVIPEEFPAETEDLSLPAEPEDLSLPAEPEDDDVALPAGTETTTQVTQPQVVRRRTSRGASTPKAEPPERDAPSEAAKPTKKGGRRRRIIR